MGSEGKTEMQRDRRTNVATYTLFSGVQHMMHLPLHPIHHVKVMTLVSC